MGDNFEGTVQGESNYIDLSLGCPRVGNSLEETGYYASPAKHANPERRSKISIFPVGSVSWEIHRLEA